jgi:hypothetical protein
VQSAVTEELKKHPSFKKTLAGKVNLSAVKKQCCLGLFLSFDI